jgi:hypothetical protein
VVVLDVKVTSTLHAVAFVAFPHGEPHVLWDWLSLALRRRGRRCEESMGVLKLALALSLSREQLGLDVLARVVGVRPIALAPDA